MQALVGRCGEPGFGTCFKAQQTYTASSRPRPRRDASFGVGGSCYFMTLLPPYPIGTECRRSTVDAERRRVFWRSERPLLRKADIRIGAAENCELRDRFTPRSSRWADIMLRGRLRPIAAITYCKECSKKISGRRYIDELCQTK